MRHIYIYSGVKPVDTGRYKVPDFVHGRLIGGSYIIIGKWRKRIQLRIIRDKPVNYVTQKMAGRDKMMTLMVGS